MEGGGERKAQIRVRFERHGKGQGSAGVRLWGMGKRSNKSGALRGGSGRGGLERSGLERCEN